MKSQTPAPGAGNRAHGDAADVDPRRRIPGTDSILALPEIATAARGLSRDAVLDAIATAQARARRFEIPPEAVADTARRLLADATAVGLTPVLNATGVVVHTNLGRAPLSAAARKALDTAAGYVDIELDLDSGRRSKNRGQAAITALMSRCPHAEDAAVVNNGAAALLLATAALAGGGEVAISRGELIEIGAGFRLPELIESAHVCLREVGATNRTHPGDYLAAAEREEARAILKVHPSNYRVTGFHSEVSVAELHGIAAERGLSLIVDVGSGLLAPHPLLPAEPDIDSALVHGADVVLASGDKLLGGPQAGLLLGRKTAIAQVKKHPLYRALRMDKLRLAALEATLTHAGAPVRDYLERDPDRLHARAAELARRLGCAPGLDAPPEVVPHEGRVGGGGAPGVALPGWAVRLPERLGAAIRRGDPAVLARVHEGYCLVDLRCVPEDRDDEVAAAIERALAESRGEG